MSVSPARALAAHLVNAVLLQGRSLTEAVNTQRTAHRGNDRSTPIDPRHLAAAQSLAYGTLRLAGRLRFFLDTLSGRPLNPPELLGPLLVGLFELDTQASPAYAAVNETVELIAHEHPRARGFANAILRNFQRRHAELGERAQLQPEAHWNLPVWWLKRLQLAYPAQWQDIVTQLNVHPPMTLRVNPRRCSVQDYADQLRAAGLDCHQTGDAALTLAEPVPVSELPHFHDGWVSVQDLGAQLAAPLLDCRDGLRVLDACAAPGGKTAHLLETYALDLTALDSDAQRLARVSDTLQRLGLQAATLAADASTPTTWWNGVPYDRILLDAPCTASGVVRRHPDGKWLKRADDLQHLMQQQTRLLEALWPLLKVGGKMLYATCSLFPGENAEQIDAFLGRHDNARLELTQPIHPGPETDGFFYARLIKT